MGNTRFKIAYLVPSLYNSIEKAMSTSLIFLKHEFNSEKEAENKIIELMDSEEIEKYGKQKEYMVYKVFSKSKASKEK